MANIRFNLDRNRIFLIYQISSVDRLKMYLGEKVDKSMWDQKKQRVKSIHPNSLKLNLLMNTIEAHINEIRIEYKIKGDRLTSMELKKIIKNKMYNVDESIVTTYAKQWMEGRKLAPSTLKGYKNKINLLDKLSPGLRFNDVNNRWRNDILKKMTHYAPNTINTMFKRLSTIMHSAWIDGVHDNKYYKTKGFIPGAVDVDNIYLSIDDINNIYNHINILDSRLKNAAVLFLIGCMTGQRYQTFSILSNKMIHHMGDTKIISIVQEKTKERVSIPISDKLVTLLNYEVKSISNQKLNKYIKEVGELCGIDNYDLITTHTARRSFATNAVLLGWDISMVMKITGHKTEREFRKYVKIDDIMAAKAMSAKMSSMF